MSWPDGALAGATWHAILVVLAQFKTELLPCRLHQTARSVYQARQTMMLHAGMDLLWTCCTVNFYRPATLSKHTKLRGRLSLISNRLPA